MILDGVNGDIRTDFRDGGFVVRVSSVDRRFGSCNERLRKFPFLYLSFEIHTIRIFVQTYNFDKFSLRLFFS